MKVYTEYEGCAYITAGKRYEVQNFLGSSGEIDIVIGKNKLKSIFLFDGDTPVCNHLNKKGVWIIEEQDKKFGKGIQ